MSAVPKPATAAPSRLRDPISAAELERRWAAARAAMRSAGIDKWRKGESPATIYSDANKGAISDLGK